MAVPRATVRHAYGQACNEHRASEILEECDGLLLFSLVYGHELALPTSFGVSCRRLQLVVKLKHEFGGTPSTTKDIRRTRTIALYKFVVYCI